MKVSPKQYAQVLFDLVQEKEGKELDGVIKSFVELLISHNQTTQVDKILDRFLGLWDKAHGLLQAEIVSAHDLAQETKTLLEKYIANSSGAKEITTELRTEKTILGGVILKYGDRILDGSIRTRVQALKQSLKN